MIVVDGQVVTGSRYAIDGARDIAPECPSEVIAFARSILQEVAWRPDPAFMLDIGQADGGLHVVELNGFSNSWLYRCDYAAVVAGVSELLRVGV